MSTFEWDEAKEARNLEKHGIGFNDASKALQGIAITQMVVRHGENRLVSVCHWSGRIIVVVWMQRVHAIRIISARARPDEREQYRQEIGKAANAR
ncbi:MAG: BrnT family toxin [Caulobacteraceae bacterium]